MPSVLQAVMQTMKQPQPTCHKQEDLTEGKLRPEGTTASQGFCWQSTCSTCGTIVTTEKMAHGDRADMSSVQAQWALHDVVGRHKWQSAPGSECTLSWPVSRPALLSSSSVALQF